MSSFQFRSCSFDDFPWLIHVYRLGLSKWCQCAVVELFMREVSESLLKNVDYGILQQFAAPSLDPRAGKLFIALSAEIDGECAKSPYFAIILDDHPDSVGAQIAHLREAGESIVSLAEVWEFQVEKYEIVRRPYVALYPLEHRVVRHFSPACVEIVGLSNMRERGYPRLR